MNEDKAFRETIPFYLFIIILILFITFAGVNNMADPGNLTCLIVREGLGLILDTGDELEVVGEATYGAEALHKVERFNPSVVLTDLQMPGRDGFAAIRHLHNDYPELAK